ncbi:MAG: glycerophosphodiester phosphodiesterase family protein [Desulfobacterales bacterium]|jgi:glycerophosphoryl diester phosphodiesterase|nr:glycerophosphodiester phosphodiesterase family protein [Desulfobacterales bacterium]
MAVPGWMEKAFYAISDFLFEKLPRPAPTPAQLKTTRLISHRGSYDNHRVYENTLAAFDRVMATGIWGIEFDLRWTADRQPVVFHDADLTRLFAEKTSIGGLSLKAVKARFPMIPTLAEVIQRYGGRMHLMVEIKPHVLPGRHLNEVLSELFSPLQPVTDFHLLSLSPQLFSAVTALPREAMIPIAETNASAVSDLVLQKGYGGMAGHYLLIQNAALKKLTRHHLPVGTGFINSRNCLHREITRGVTWLFSDRAIELQRLISVPRSVK